MPVAYWLARESLRAESDIHATDEAAPEGEVYQNTPKEK